MPIKAPFEPFFTVPLETLSNFIQEGYYYGAFIRHYNNPTFIPCWGYNDLRRSGNIFIDCSSFSYPVSDIPAISVFKDGIDLQSAWGPIERTCLLKHPDESFIKLLKFSGLTFDTLVDTYDVLSTKEELKSLLDVCLKTTQIPLQDYKGYFDDGYLLRELIS